MQATAAKPTSELAREMLTLVSYLMSASTPEFFRFLGEADVSLTQVKVMHMLDAPGPDRSLKEMSEALSFSLAGMSRSIDALHHRGLVERREDEHDRRIKRVRITSQGRDLLRRINEMRVAWLEQFVSTLPDDQRDRLLDALSPIVEREEIAAFRPEGASSE